MRAQLLQGMRAQLLQNLAEPWSFKVLSGRETAENPDIYRLVADVAIEDPKAFHEAIYKKHNSLSFTDQPCDAIALFITAAFSATEYVYGINVFDKELLDYANQKELWKEMAETVVEG